MGWTDTREPDMSLTEPATQTDADAQPGRGTGERLVIAGSVLVTLLAIVGIAYLALGGDEPEATPPPPVAVDEPAEPDPVEPPVAQTPADVAAAEAQERYREFLRIDDQIGREGYESSARYDTVLVSPQRALEEVEFRQAQQLPDARLVGNKDLTALSVVSVDLEPEPGGYPTVVLQACVDVSGVDVVDGSGNSLVSPERVDRTRSTVTLYRLEATAERAEGWYVTEATSLGEPC
jgi:hypothetical protein